MVWGIVTFGFPGCKPAAVSFIDLVTASSYNRGSLSHAPGRDHMTQQSSTIRTSDIERLLLWAVRVGVMATLIVPLVVTTSTYFPYVVGKAIYARVIIEITFALWLILVLYFSDYRPSRSWILLAFGAWLLVSLVAGFTGVSFTRSFWSTYERMQGIFDLAHWFAFVLVASSVFRSLWDWKVLFTVNLAVGAVVSWLGVGNHFDVFSVDILGTSQRIESTLGNATYVGAYTMVNAMIGLGMIIHSYAGPAGQPSAEVRRRASVRRRRRRAERVDRGGSSFDGVTWLRVFWVLTIVINLWALWLTGTRGAIIGMGAGAVVFGVVYLAWGNMKAVRWASLGVLIATVLAVSLVVLMRTTSALDPLAESSTTLSRLASIGLDDTSARGRLVAVQAGVRAFQDRPILGWGPENFLIAWGRYFDVDSGITERFDQAHSKVFEELTTKGVIGLAAYLLIWLTMASVLLASFRRRSGLEQVFIAVIGATAAAYFVQNMFLFDTTTTTLLFAILVAFLISEERRLRADDSSDGDAARRLTLFPDGLAQRVSGVARSSAGVAVAIVVVSVATGALLTYTFKPYTAATSVVQGLVGQADWSQTSESLSQAISEFPGLGNYARIILISRATNVVGELSDEDFPGAVEVVKAEGQAGLEVEPENWRLRGLLTQFYQAASSRDRAYLAVAREHLDEAIELAPRTRNVLLLIEQQEDLESR